MTAHPIDRITVHPPVIIQNLAVFPLFLSTTDGPAYITSSVAIEHHGMVVKEVSDGGSVPNLMVENPSELCVLLLDGEELRGAKQNRIINTTLLLAPRSRTMIPVSCTESGRWSYSSPTFSSAKTVMPVKARRRKTRSVSHSLQMNLSYQSDQGEVWEQVDELHHKIGSHSPTRAMADAFERVRQDLESAIEKIPLQENQAGLIALIDNKPAGMDLLSRPEAYAELHPQILQSYAMEALANKRSALYFNREPGKGEPVNEPDTLAAKAFLERCAAIEGQSFDSVGLGTDWRFIRDPIVGSGLEVEDCWIHMAYFVDEQEGSSGERLRRGLARMSRRSRFRRE